MSLASMALEAVHKGNELDDYESIHILSGLVTFDRKMRIRLGDAAQRLRALLLNSCGAPKTVFHGTSIDAALKIAREGFRSSRDVWVSERLSHVYAAEHGRENAVVQAQMYDDGRSIGATATSGVLTVANPMLLLPVAVYRIDEQAFAPSAPPLATRQRGSMRNADV